MPTLNEQVSPRHLWLRAELDMRRAATGIWITGDSSEGRPLFCVTNVEIKEHESGQEADPLCYLLDEQVQCLMNDLWRAGFRPSNGVASTGQIEATQAHLETVKGVLDRALTKMWGA